MDASIESSRKGQPISSIARASFGAAGKRSTRFVRRSWNSVTSAGLMITRKPQTAGVRPCESTAEIGRTTSNAK